MKPRDVIHKDLRNIDRIRMILKEPAVSVQRLLNLRLVICVTINKY